MLKAASSRGLAGCVAMRKKGRDNIWEDSNSLFFAGRFSPRTTPNWKPLPPCLFKQWKCMPKKSAFAISWTLMNERSQIERHQVNPFFFIETSKQSQLSSQEMHFKIFLFILVLEHKVFFARILKSFQSRAWTKQYFSTGTHRPWESCVTLVIMIFKFSNKRELEESLHQFFKSGIPEISPGCVQRFLFYANGGKIGFVVLTSASRSPNNHYLNVAWK